MKSVDESLRYLLTKKTPRLNHTRESLGVYAKGSGGGRMTSSDRRDLARDITQSVAEMTSGITAAIIRGREARRARPAAPVEPAVPDTFGGEPYGVEARSPWGTIALGGTAVVIIGGLLLYIATTKKK